MKIDLTFEQATALGKAVGLVLEHLDVTECERKSFKKAREALYQSIGYDEILENSQLEVNLANFLTYSTRPRSFYSHCGTEYRGKFGYEQVEGAISVDLLIYRFDDDEAVEVTYGETRESEDYSMPFIQFTWRPAAVSSETYCFAVLPETRIAVKISTPTNVKEATYLVTEQGVEEQSETIWLEIWKSK